MNQAIVSVLESITLIAGGDVSDSLLKAALALAPEVVAADGGADHCRAHGLMPRAVIGDLDSISAAARALFKERLHPIAEQNSTDFDKALRHIDAPLVLALGALGGRRDHELAAMNALVRHPARRCILIGAQSLIFHCPPRLELGLAPGSDLGLFPFARCRIASEGLEWPTAGIDFAPDGRIGTSNRCAAPRQILQPDGAGMLVILPRAALPLAAAALSNSAR